MLQAESESSSWMSFMSGEIELMKAWGFIRRSPSDFMIQKSATQNNSMRVTKCCFSIPDWNSFRVNWNLDGQDHFLVKQIFPHGAVEVQHPDGHSFKVNGQRLKLYLGTWEENAGQEEFRLYPIITWGQRHENVEPTTLTKSARWEATHTNR